MACRTNYEFEQRIGTALGLGAGPEVPILRGVRVIELEL